MAYQTKAGLQVDEKLAGFIEGECLPGSGLTADAFWSGFADIVAEFTPENRTLLAFREELQEKIDAWHDDRKGADLDADAYQVFLREIGYLSDEPAPFSIGSENNDEEIARLAGPQLVVPSRNARFALNAANARWGSLYDALYGTDAIPGAAEPGGYDKARGDKVIRWTKSFLDDVAPLASGNHNDVAGYIVSNGALEPALKDPVQFAGYRGDADAPSSILLRNNGLHIEIIIDGESAIGKDDKAGVSDVILESALSTIIDMEDSIAAVDVDDKLEAYGNWLGLIRGDLEATFQKGGKTLTRKMEADREYKKPNGELLTLHGRSLLLVRNVGHLMTNPSILLEDGSEIFEGVMDGVVSSLIASG